MYSNELIAKIEAGCRYAGSSKVEAYIYSGAITDAINIIRRELPAEPEKKVVPLKKKVEPSEEF